MADDKKKTKAQQGADTPVDAKQLEAALNERKKALDEKEQGLNERENALMVLQETLNKQELLLKEKEENVMVLESDYKEREETLKALEDTLKERKKNLDEREKALKSKDKATKAPKKHEPVKFEFREQKYQFSKYAPENIRVLGTVMSQEEIAKDEETLVYLIGGNSSLIEKSI